MAAPIQDPSASPSELHRYCGAVIEACWLMAVMAVPLLYNSHGRDGFEPFKAAFVRLFAFVLLPAATVRIVGKVSTAPTSSDFWRNPLRVAFVYALLAYTAAILVSIEFSVFPFQSFWGSYLQRQGGLTEFCYLGFFLAVAVELRTEAQIRRLITALLVPTIPMALIALMQHAGLDPLRILGPDGGRVFSLAGNPIYLAAYLGMIFPFTVLRILDLGPWNGKLRPLRAAAFVFYSGLAVLQISAFLFAESRGPLLGLLAGMSFFAVAHAARTNRSWLASILAIIVLIFAFLIILGIPSGPLTSLTRSPTANRLAGALPPAVSTNEGRIDLWKQAARLLVLSEPLRFPSGAVDRWNALRPLVGYGPETLEYVLPMRFSFGSAAPPLMSRFHNRFWDIWYSSGLIGTLAFLALVVLAFGSGYRRLGWIRSQSDWVRFLALVILSMAGLSAALVVRFGSGFLGLGVMCGLSLGLTSYVVVWGLCSAPTGPPRIRTDNREAVLLSALAALIGHLVETGFAFPVAATALLFWIFIGMALEMPVRRPDAELKARSPMPPSAPREWARCVVGAALTTILVTFAFVGLVAFEPVGIGAVLSQSLKQIKTGGGSSHQLDIVLLPSWIGAMFAFWADDDRWARGSGWLGGFLAGALISGLAGVFWAVAQASQISMASHLPPGAVRTAGAFLQSWHYEAMGPGLMATCLLLVAACGWSCCDSGLAGSGRSSALERRTGVAMLAAMALLSWFACVNPVRADALAGLANSLNRAGQLPSAIAAYRKALVLNGNSSAYRFEQAQLLMAAAESSSDRHLFDTGMGAAETLERDGRKISTLDPQGALLLGKIYERWAAGPVTPDRRLILAREARQSFEEALAFKPVAEYALVDLAAVESIFLDDAVGSADALRRADALVSDDNAGDWFNSYTQSSTLARSSELGRFYALRAFAYCEKAIASATRRHQSTFSLNLLRGILHHRFGELPQARTAFQAAADEDHNADDWRAESLLAATLRSLGDNKLAILHITRAIELAPEQSQPALMIALQQMTAQPTTPPQLH